jgi:hypothetical protein
MVDLKLTEEQAKWLRKHLDDLLDDAHWGRGVLRGDGDAKEHAQTIHDKIELEEDRKW